MNLATTRFRWTRLAAGLLVLTAALGPTTSLAKEFNATSLIIPASIEYQTNDGVLNTYAIVYLALWKNADRVAQGKKPITFYWAVQPNKLSQYRCNTASDDLPKYSPSFNDNDGCDFYIDRAGGRPVAKLNVSTGQDGTTAFSASRVKYAAALGPSRCDNKCTGGATFDINDSKKVVKYLGGSWIVDSSDRQAFIDFLKTVPTLAAGINIHSARSKFSAPVASAISTQPPRIGLIGSNQTAFLVNVLENAGICGAIEAAGSTCGGTFSAAGFTPGVVYDYYPNAADLLGVVSGYPHGRLNGVVEQKTYGILWAGDSANPDVSMTAQIAYFADRRGTTFAEYDAPYKIELAAPRFHTTAGFQDFNPNIATYEDCNDQFLPAGSMFKGAGGDCLVYGAANQPFAQTGNFLFDGGQGSYKGYTPKPDPNDADGLVTGVMQVLQAKTGGTNPIVASAWYYQNDPSKGLILYLAGHKFDNDRYWGERVILNTLFAQLVALPELELARSEPVGYKDTTVSPNTTRVYQGTYVPLPLPDSNDILTYNPAAAQIWQFPYTRGHLYEYDVANIASAAQLFSANKNWDAAAVGVLPLPKDRKIFTFVNGSAKLGWKKIDFDYRQTGSACADHDADSKCDLSELFAACNAAGVTTAALEAKTVNGAQAQKLGVLVQLARGHCSAHSPAITGTPIYEPLDAECDCKQGGVNCGENPQNNRARLGGIDHSSGAVVGPSRYLTNAPWSTRPVVAYAAGLDGMVHAFYVSGSTAWTADGKTLPAGVVRGQELWAFVPPAQVCGIATNTAMVDGSLNVIDVFGDFPIDANNDGVIDWTATSEKPDKIREWRTLLIASAGLGGSELFALDVTNPLKPVLLWHLGGATEKDGRFDLNRDGQFVSGEVFSKSNQTTFALKWFDWDDGDEDGTTAYIPTDYNVSDSTAAGAAVIEAVKFGRYDYRNMGLAYSAPVAKVWMGNSFQYVVYLATSAADYTSATPTGYRGVEVFAIDAMSGEKLWQWEHLYASTDASGIDNGIPPAVALGDITANGSTERIYVGDMEGRLWELSARDGRNLNYLKGSDGKFWSFPLYGTPVMAGTGADDATKALYTVDGGGLGQQPLTTPIGQGRFTAAPALTSSFDPALLVGRLAMIVGTMGVDWSIAPHERGHLYVIPAYPGGGTRLEPPIDVTAPRDPKRFGIVLPKAVWDVPLDVGERVYGMPRVANNTIVFNTAFGSFAGDISSSYLDSGNLKLVSSTSTDTRANESKSFGGAVIIGGSVVITTDSHIRVLANPPASLSQASTAQSTFNRSTPSVVKSWEPVSK